MTRKDMEFSVIKNKDLSRRKGPIWGDGVRKDRWYASFIPKKDRNPSGY